MHERADDVRRRHAADPLAGRHIADHGVEQAVQVARRRRVRGLRTATKARRRHGLDRGDHPAVNAGLVDGLA